MSEKYDLLVFIGRFQPFHSGHRRVVELALRKASQLLILVGSSYQARTIKNPFTYEERETMIQQSLDPQHISRLTIRPIRDYLYNEQRWEAQVQQRVDALLSGKAFVHDDAGGNTYVAHKSNLRVGIIGYEKDDSSYYLKSFPQWDYIDVGRDYDGTIDATTLRNLWLSGQSPRFAAGALHVAVHDFIFKQFPKKEYQRLAKEYEQITQYRKAWESAPYPPTFVTTDAVVVQSGHILLVQRKASPGEGLWALPGGFLNNAEIIEDGMIRELREETKLKVPEPVLRGSIRARKVFDHPGRSLRGRTITNAFLIELAAGPLPPVKGSDDARKAKWFSLAEFEKMEDNMFEDHFSIINYFLGRV